MSITQIVAYIQRPQVEPVFAEIAYVVLFQPIAELVRVFRANVKLPLVQLLLRDSLFHGFLCDSVIFVPRQPVLLEILQGYAVLPVRFVLQRLDSGAFLDDLSLFGWTRLSYEHGKCMNNIFLRRGICNRFSVLSICNDMYQRGFLPNRGTINMLEIIQKDFFISYNHKDEDVATWIAQTLEDNGYQVIIQAWDFHAGCNFVLEMNKALTSCKRVIAVISENYLQSNYTPSEWAETFRNDPKGENRDLIPVFIEDNLSIKGLLGTIVGIKLAGLLDPNKPTELNKAKEKLLNGLKTPERKSKYAASEDSQTRHVLFIDIDKRGEIINSTESLVSIVKWIAEQCPPDIDIKVADERIKRAVIEANEAEEAMRNQSGEWNAQENRLLFATKKLNKLQYYTEVLMRDLQFFAEINYIYKYIQINRSDDFFEFVKVLKYNIEGGTFKKMNRKSSVIIDFTLESGHTKHTYYFCVPLTRDEILHTGLSDNCGFMDVALLKYESFSREAQREIIAAFCDDFTRMIENGWSELQDNAIAKSLYNYRVGLH